MKNIIKQSGCWGWRGAITKQGYARMRTFGRKQVNASRFSYELYNGPVSRDLYVCHKCDNPICVNPEHLFLGTSKDNSSDMVSKGRQCKGERQKLAKLTKEKADKIRYIYKSGGIFQRDLAKQFGVNQRVIWSIVNNLTWK